MIQSIRFRLLLVMCAVAFFSMASMIAANNGSVPPGQSRGLRAESRGIKIKLTRDNGVVATITQLVGRTVIVEFDSRRFGLTPKVNDRTGEYSVAIQRIEDTVAVNIAELPLSERGNNAVGVHPKNLGFSIEVINIPPVARLDGGAKMESVSFSPAGSFLQASVCCVTCSGTTVCACAVTMECGSCCVGACCNMWD